MPDSTSHPFGGVTDLFSEMNRIRDIGVHGRESSPTEERQRTHASAWVPTTDIVTQGSDLLIRIELAGVAPEDVHLGFAHSILTVSGRRKTELQDEANSTFYVRERFYGEFRRSITLPDTTAADDIDAEFADGLVEILVRGAATEAGSTRIELRDRTSGTTRRTLG